jgi:hypothetical protein
MTLLARHQMSLATALSIVIATCSGRLIAANPLEINFQLPSPPQERVWIDDSGTHRVTATFVRFESDSVRLRKAVGDDVLAPIFRVSESDIAYLRRRANHRSAEAETWRSLFAVGEGCLVEYFTDTSLDEIGKVGIVSQIDFQTQQTEPYTGGKPIKKIREGWYEDFAIRWSGVIVPRYSERYRLAIEVDDGGILWLDGKLLVHSWKWQGAQEYAAEVELEAGRPYPFKLLYYNGPFGGSAKLSWSSRSQPKEIIPRERLYLPMYPLDPPLAESLPPMAGRVQISAIPLVAVVQHDPRSNKPSLFLRPLSRGGYTLGWTDTDSRIHLTELDSNLQPTGKDFKTAGVDLRGLTVDSDGTTTLMIAQNPERMWVMRLDPAGKLLWRKVLVGDKGREADQHFLDEHFSFTGRLATSGSDVAVHFGHSWNTGTSGTHQGGYFARLDPRGNLEQENKWTVSHSLDQRLMFHGGSYLTLSAGDCYPKGLWFENRTVGFGRIIYPAEIEREAFGNCGGQVNARIGSLVPLGSGVGIVFTTKIGESWEAMYVHLAEDCTVIRQVQLTDTPDQDEQLVRMASQRDQLLVAWQSTAGRTELRQMTANGVFVSEPTNVDFPLSAGDDLIELPGGGVGWLVATAGERETRLIRVGP